MKTNAMKRLSALLLLACGLAASVFAQDRIDLSGEWEFSTDRPVYDQTITLPGSMLTNGKGDDVSVDTRWTGSLYDSSYFYNPYMERYRQKGQMKFPFFLTPEKHFVGTAWYARTVKVPSEWKKRRVTLFLERPHIETTVYINGVEAGHQLSLSTPHVYDVTAFLKPGSDNRIEIKVYNGIENVCVGQDSHSVTDQTQGNWNGIVGTMALETTEKNYLEDVKVFPDVVRKSAQVKVKFVSARRKNHLRFLLFDPRRGLEQALVVDKEITVEGTDTASVVVSLGDKMQLWDEFQPVVYPLEVCLNPSRGSKAGEDCRQVSFGMRNIQAQGRQLVLNGKPIWLRGTVENCTFPLTGYPAMDVKEWERIIRKCKEYGLNAMRFHSYCPPEAAFVAADKLGFYLQPEGPSWPNHGVKLRSGQAIDQYLEAETRRIVDAYGNHPSFLLMAAGNEPAGNWVAWCNDWVRSMKAYDPRRLYAGASVGGGWAWDDASDFHVKGGGRGLDWDRQAPQSTDDYYDDVLHPRNFKPTEGQTENTSPIVAHEQGQWCAFPDFSEMSQYTGVYKARNFEIFRDLLRDNGMEGQDRKFLEASGRLQTLAYKYEIERNLRTKDYAGFLLLGLNDYSGQGTALEGALNVFWREKGYVDGKAWREFCSEVVALAEFPKFVYRNTEKLEVSVQLYNASSQPLRQAQTAYYIRDSHEREVAHGLLARQDEPMGKNLALGKVVFDLHQFDKPIKLTLTVVTTPQGEKVAAYTNHWDFWVYPDTLAPEPSARQLFSNQVFVTDTIDGRALAVLQKGGKVVVLADGKVRYGNDVRHHFLPVFWNTSWFKMRPPHTTGAYIQRDHPVFGDFPTDNWQNLNWWELVNRAQVMNLSAFPKSYQPIVQPIDTWHVSRKLGMMIEAQVLNGKLLMTTLDLSSHLDRRLVARQLRKSVLDYVQSDAFKPTMRLDVQVLKDLFTKTAPPVNMFTHDSPDELKPKIK